VEPHQALAAHRPGHPVAGDLLAWAEVAEGQWE
jgi:hypothetical protein